MLRYPCPPLVGELKGVDVSILPVAPPKGHSIAPKSLLNSKLKSCGYTVGQPWDSATPKEIPYPEMD